MGRETNNDNIFMMVKTFDKELKLCQTVNGQLLTVNALIHEL